MEFVAGKLNSNYLESVVNKNINDCSEVVAVVPYCNSTRLFDLCKKAGKRVTFFGRLDASLPVDIPILKWFIEQKSPNYSCYLLHGGLHAKIIWMKGEGVYIGSANLTDRGWIDNIEAGVFLPETTLEAHGTSTELENLVDEVRKRSTPVNSEIVSMLVELKRRRAELSKIEGDINEWFKKNCRVPKIPSLVSVNKTKSADRQKNNFLKEWNETLQLLRSISHRLRDYRPDWVGQEVPDGVHVDQFLHAFYYLRVREGMKQPFDDYFEKNKHNPEAALIEQMKWWSRGEYPHDDEYNFITNWAPSSRELLAQDRLGSLSESEFITLTCQIHAIREHSIKQESEFLGLSSGSHPADMKREEFGKWLYRQKSKHGIAVLETVDYVLYGGDYASVPDRLWEATRPGKWKIDHMGLSSLGEIVGWALPDVFPPRNSRTSKALRALGNPVAIY